MNARVENSSGPPDAKVRSRWLAAGAPKRLAVLLWMTSTLLTGVSALSSQAAPQTASAGVVRAFEVVVLGSAGGLDEGNLSAYLLRARGDDAWICLDAGTVRDGLRAARAVLGADADEMLRRHIAAYLISHPHFDHVAGLIINSTDDTAKPIIGLTTTLDALRDHVFNWQVWPNFTNEGIRPLRQYTLTRVRPGQAVAMAGTSLRCEAWPLSHGGVTSTAFIVSHGEDCIVYLGDTGADSVEQAHTLDDLWRRIAPQVRSRHLRALFIEASYPDTRPPGQLFGHLTPALVIHELHHLAATADAAHVGTVLRGLPVVITHVKPGGNLDRQAADRTAAALARQNDLRVRFIVPRRGEHLDL